jgi:hypothetical protein
MYYNRFEYKHKGVTVISKVKLLPGRCHLQLSIQEITFHGIFLFFPQTLRGSAGVLPDIGHLCFVSYPF